MDALNAEFEKGKGYRHKEAFCLMWYICDLCKASERIWNSRDGVTPFGGIFCPSCGNNAMTHHLWNSDTCVPDHKLCDGQRFFRDGTADEAVAIMKKRIARARTHTKIERALEEELLRQARNQTGEEWGRKGWPMIDRYREPKL